ncbi:cation diffusion facilitator family transporter [Kribbella endophytica]
MSTPDQASGLRPEAGTSTPAAVPEGGVPAPGSRLELTLQPVQLPPAASTWTTDPELRRKLSRRAQLLAGASVTYNVIEAVIAITAGLVAGSVALVGFGLDSVVEVSSGLIILWQFRHRLPETREKQALRLLAFSFFGLAAYVGFESVRTLITGANPETSPVGIGLAIASLIVMPFLSWAQRRTGKALGSNAVVADSTQTLLCTYLSAVLLIGLLLNATLGWGWADPIAGLIVAAVAIREGREAWRGEGCCSPIAGNAGAGSASAGSTTVGGIAAGGATAACGCSGSTCADGCCN